jgi:hypothetical protein
LRAPHPFPARMAPDLALASVKRAQDGPILDPMCGSGVVLKAAQAAGIEAVGLDVDPLAVLMSRVWTSEPTVDLEGAAADLTARALITRVRSLDWIDNDPETAAFIEFWFARSQRDDLRRIAKCLQEMGTSADADGLRLALSRTIIVKAGGASLANDVSHSRPHRTRMDNDYDVISGIRAAARQVQHALSQDSRSRPSVAVKLGDARRMGGVDNESIGMIVTSPPYLNAIDYLRGHRMALVWLGHQIGDLRSIRANSVGAERATER